MRPRMLDCRSKRGRRLVTAMFAAFTLFYSLSAQGQPLRAIERGATRATRARIVRLFRRDWLRDSHLPVVRLPRARTVFRYVTPNASKAEVAQGLKVGTHTTVKATRGRPLSAAVAQRRYGLAARPAFRETIDLARSVRVRIGKVLGGSRGIGEITIRQRVAPKAIRRIVPIR